jgi:hypothetical protein
MACRVVRAGWLGPLLWMVALSTSAGDAAFDFKGLAFGATPAEALRHFRHLRCGYGERESPLRDTVCVEDPSARCSPPQVFRIPAEHWQCAERLATLRTYAGIDVSDLRLHFVEGRLLRVVLGFPTAEFDAVVAALGARYGTPRSSASSEVRNRFGTIFRDTVTRWALPGGDEVRVSRLSSDFSRGAVTLVGAGRPPRPASASAATIAPTGDPDRSI